MRVERRGAQVRLVYERGGKEVEAIGLAADFPNVLGLLVAQMTREGFSPEEICNAVRKALEEVKKPEVISA